MLDKMAEIAKAEEFGEPVLDWDQDLRLLHITDPFFAFLSANDVVFYDSETEIEKINKPIDELTELQIPVLGLVFGY